MPQLRGGNIPQGRLDVRSALMRVYTAHKDGLPYPACALSDGVADELLRSGAILWDGRLYWLTAHGARLWASWTFPKCQFVEEKGARLLVAIHNRSQAVRCTTPGCLRARLLMQNHSSDAVLTVHCKIHNDLNEE